MAERRMLSKTISTSRKVNRLGDRTALLYTWLIPHTDDYGRMEGDAMSVKAKVLPMRINTEMEVDQDLDLLENAGLIERYKVDKEQYLEILNFDSFQTFRSDRPRRSEYPDKEGKLTEDNHMDTNGVPVGDNAPPKIREVKGREVKLSKDIYTPKFDEFWKLYPKKVGKPKTFDLWKSLSLKEMDSILEDVPKRKLDDKWINGFIKDPERYIKNRQWEDEIIAPRNRNQPSNIIKANEGKYKKS